MPPQTFNVSDGQPAPRRDFYIHWARLLGLPEPLFLDPAPGSAERGRGNKRVCNRRMIAELGVSLKYPTYQDGLAAIAAAPAEKAD
jgi:hypothetical protein